MLTSINVYDFFFKPQLIKEILNQSECAWLETILRKQTYDESVSKVVKFNIEDALLKGENYGSQVYRLKLEIILNNGKKFKKSLIMKREHAPNDASAGHIELPVFKTEIKVILDSLCIKCIAAMTYNTCLSASVGLSNVDRCSISKITYNWS